MSLQDLPALRRRSLTSCAWLAIAALAFGTAQAQDTATEPTPVDAQKELTPVDAQSIAREAYLFGFPIVENYKAMHAAAIDEDGEDYLAPMNRLSHRDHLADSLEIVGVTPEIDASYSLVWLDLRSEPQVLAVPAVEEGRYYSIQLIDFFKYTFDYIGSRTTGNGAGRYVIAGPGWTGDAPADIGRMIRCETAFALAVYRTELRGPEDLEQVQEIQSRYTIQGLTGLLGLPEPEPGPALAFHRPGSEAEDALAFFSSLNFLLQFCPPHPSEQALMERLARIGVAAGARFDTSEVSNEVQNALRTGIKEGDGVVTAAAAKLKVAEVMGTRDFLGADYIRRAVAAKIGLYGLSKEEALYTLYLKDGEGKPLDARTASYVLKLGEKELPPVQGFWSVTMYDGESKSLVPAASRHGINSSMMPDLARNADGSATLYLQHEAPEDQAESNWLPAPNGPFYLVMRLYWPRPEAYDGTWSPPLVWRATAAPETTTPKPAGTESAEEVQPSVLVAEAKPELERPTIWGEPTEVQVLIYVIDVDEVNSADQSFAASVFIRSRWKNPFLRHQGPGPLHRTLTEVWNPRLTIIGQQMQWLSYPESVRIEPDGTVDYSQKVWGRFSQPLKLQDFPFDEQELSIHIVAAGLPESHVKMMALVNDNGGTSRIAPSFSLPDFDVLSWNASVQAYDTGQGPVGVAGYEMKISVARRTTYYILKVIIPLCLIVIMSWLPRWIDPKEIGTNVGISTSAFLTLVAYMFAITVLLPRVSYVTRMDRFILLSTLMVFAGLIQTGMNTVLVQGAKRGLPLHIDRWSRVIYPVLFVLVLAVSFAP